MNLHAFSQPEDLQQLDRLVDGELSGGERRELLARLEREPDGWRRLALSFLESQCWQETARATSEPSVDPQPVPSIDSLTADNRPTRRFDGRWKPWMSASLAMAASFLVAFALGVALRGTWNSGGQPPTLVADSADRALADALASRQRDARTESDLRADMRAAELAALEQQAAYNEVSADDATEFWLPADLGDGDATDGGSSSSQSPAVPAQVVESLKRLGHEVQTHRSLWPVDLRNGQRALVPVDEVEIRYVGNEYQ